LPGKQRGSAGRDVADFIQDYWRITEHTIANPGRAHASNGLAGAPRTAVLARRVARQAGIAKRVGPHTLRHAFITAGLDAGVPLRDVQEAASHADPRTTMRYDRGRQSLDRHATYIVATFVAGASR
jgi:integrase